MDVKTRKRIYEALAIFGFIASMVVLGFGYKWGAFCVFWFFFFLSYELFKNDVRKNPYDWPIKKDKDNEIKEKKISPTNNYLIPMLLIAALFFSLVMIIGSW